MLAMYLKYTYSLPCLGKGSVDFFRDASSNQERIYMLASPSSMAKLAVPTDPYTSQGRAVISYSNDKYHWYNHIWKLNVLKKDCQSYQRKKHLYWGLSQASFGSKAPSSFSFQEEVLDVLNDSSDYPRCSDFQPDQHFCSF